MSIPLLPRCLVLAAVVVVGGPQEQTPPQLALVNARVFTGVEARPWAGALATSGERIAAVGTTSEIRKLAGQSTRVIDLGGRLVVPGFNDAHTHPEALPEAVRLEGPPALQQDPTLDEILKRLKTAVAQSRPDGWIFGEIGAAVLDDPGATRLALDAVAPDRLVMLTAWTGHGTLFNSAALRRLGVGDNEPDPPGGFYRRMPDGKTLSGIAQEYAEFRLRQRVAMQAGPAAQLAAFRQFADEAVAFGITSIQAMMTSMPTAEAAKLLSPAELPVRVRLIDFPMTNVSAWRAPPERPGPSSRLTVSGTKWIVDGTPVERLMFLREPYADRNVRGRANYSGSDLQPFLERALKAREQPMLHAVGDAAIDLVLTALEASGGETWRRLRPRLEHGDMLRRDHFDRARRLGVVLVQNPSHFMIPQIMKPRLGAARLAVNQAVKSSSRAGIPLALGSDGPLNPSLNVMFAITHANNPAEALTRGQAVAAYTHGAAFAEFQEEAKGRIVPGMLADIAVLSQDIFKVPPDALPATTSVLTIVGGRIVHESPREK